MIHRHGENYGISFEDSTGNGLTGIMVISDHIGEVNEMVKKDKEGMMDARKEAAF